MDLEAVVRMLCAGELTAEEVLKRTPAARVDDVTEVLLRHLKHEEVRHALYARIASAPLAEFETLRMAYFKHCERGPVVAASARRTVLP